MRQETRIVIAILAVGLVAAIVILVRSGSGGDTVRGIGMRLDLVEDGPLQLRLGGPLWRGRTERDEDGAPDVAYIPRDAPLTIGVTGRDGRRPTATEVSIDGRIVARRRLCRASPCPSEARTTLKPGRVARLGLHRVTVLARGGAPGELVRTKFEVTIGKEPVVLGGEPVARRATAAPPPTVGRADRRRTLAIIERERRSGALRAVLGTARPAVVQLGRLSSAGRQQGTTVLLGLPTLRRHVRAKVPAYLPLKRAGAGFRVRRVTLSAPILRDLLVDVDLVRRRLIAVQPGPRSRTDHRQQSVGPTPVDSPSDTSRAEPRLVRLSDQGPAFMNYDGTASLRRAARDWPVSLVFTGNATVGKVKRALRTLGLKRRGRTAYLPYRVASAGLRFDGDGGLKTACDRQGTDIHLRLYAPSATNRFRDREYGDVVVATAHLDRGDQCGAGPKLFGFSERAENQIAARVTSRLGWAVKRDYLTLGNAEPYRRDIGDSAHVWWSDGRATQIVVP